ncbi:allatostatin-A receptor-like [Schistocerca piceifrons]|uniref:allatostatin-A receptor-like n=1 Tax=Schistocerca piceifrons TaxID=274613 RepID=UPI001F5FB2FC|nr:allatostatin-A receptor-like [Schistocerca piceifrons]
MVARLQVVQYLIVVTCYASVYTLVLMSFDRYLAVVHPVSSMGLRTQRHALSAIAVTWVVILAACAPVYTSHGVVGYDFEKIHHTACVFLEATHNKPAFQILREYTTPSRRTALPCTRHIVSVSYVTED